jgi:hypothetical protein
MAAVGGHRTGTCSTFSPTHDGSLCIWAQHLAPATKRPFGPPFAVYRFHGRRRSLSVLAFGYGLVLDKLYFGLQETTGNVWLAELAQNQK